jgi:hypothetical protein
LPHRLNFERAIISLQKVVCYTTGMSKSDYLKDYYKSLEEAPLDVLEEYEGNALAALEDYKVAGNEKAAKEIENDLKMVRELMDKRRAK